MANLLDVIVGGALALSEGRPKVVRGPERAYAFRRQLVKELEAGSKRLEDIRNSTVG